MGRQKKGFNWKSRIQKDGTLDNTETLRLQSSLADDSLKSENINDPNVSVLPSKKRTFKASLETKRKELEKITERKAKKAARADLLEKLVEVQVPEEELKSLTSLSQVQTKGLKRQFAEDEKAKAMDNKPSSSDKPIVPISRAKRSKVKNDRPPSNNDPSVLGFDEESSSSDEEDEESDEEMKEEPNEIQPSSDPETPPSPESKKLPNHSLKPDDASPMKTDESKSVSAVATPSMPARKTIFVPLNRTPDIVSSREKLPIIAEEQAIMEAISENPVLVLAGETGSGKTTQVPQFLYEAGYAQDGKMIGVTEPRRVAAVSMSKRVAQEMNLDFGEEVGYQIRFEGNSTDSTKIKFMTDGVLLREIEKDFLLTKYSVIILDEAHERSVFTDILIGLLSRIVPKRNKSGDPLRLVIMSATLRIEDFTENKRLFKVPPPVIKVESRQFDVTAHFNKKTPEDYVHESLKKGGILVFLTGQREVNLVVRKLRAMFRSSKDASLVSDLDSEGEENIESELRAAISKVKKKKKTDKAPASFETDALDCREEDKVSDMEEDEDTPSNKLGQPLWVLPLYSLLNSDKQSKVFQPPPEGYRLCVVATNIAETSLTIPGIKYVVDSGKVKTKFYDKVTGVSTYHANQRAGRAGRTAAGHCYRLYSSAVYENEFQMHCDPEITKRPVDDLVLQMKAMCMENIQVAEKKLAPGNVSYKELKEIQYKGRITKLGKAISSFPLSPKFGKMLALSHQHDLLPYSITLVAALSVQEVLLETPIGSGEELSEQMKKRYDKSEISKIRRAWAGKGNSYLLGDPMVLIRAVGAAEYDGCSPDFCHRYGLRLKAMREIRKLRRQLTNEVNIVLPGKNLALDPQLKPPSDEDAKLLRQIILSGLPDQVASKIHKEGKEWKFAYRFGQLEEPVFMHQTSVLRSLLPEWVCFQEVIEIKGKMYMRGLTVIDP
ncbi:Putative ATPdependent RNA helicase kurzlike, partial [Caligus rogercresseyi]